MVTAQHDNQLSTASLLESLAGPPEDAAGRLAAGAVTEPAELLGAKERFEQKQTLEHLAEQRERDEAAAAGLDPDIWAALPQEARERVMSVPSKVERKQFATVGQEQMTALGGSVMSQGQAEALARQLLNKEDYRSYVLMYRRPMKHIDGKWYHPDMQKIQREDSYIKQALAAGFSLYPKYPLLPQPPLVCDVPGVSGDICGERVFTAAELRTHQEWTHPLEFKAAREVREERARSALLQQQQLTNQLMLKIVAGQGGLSAETQAEIAALDAGVA